MAFKSNFNAVRWSKGDGKPMYVEGISDRELLAAARRLYVGVVPPYAVKARMEKVDRTSEWSAKFDVPDGDDWRRVILVGVALKRDGGAPFVWADRQAVIERIAPRPRPRAFDTARFATVKWDKHNCPVSIEGGSRRGLRGVADRMYAGVAPVYEPSEEARIREVDLTSDWSAELDVPRARNWESVIVVGVALMRDDSAPRVWAEMQSASPTARHAADPGGF